MNGFWPRHGNNAFDQPRNLYLNKVKKLFEKHKNVFTNAAFGEWQRCCAARGLLTLHVDPTTAAISQVPALALIFLEPPVHRRVPSATCPASYVTSWRQNQSELLC